MICVVIKGPTFEKAEKQIKDAVNEGADLVELRLDLFNEIDDESIKLLRSAAFIPVLFTLRSVAQGGNYHGSEEELHRLIALNPDYMDIEYDVPCIKGYQQTKILISYHNFLETPKDLEGLYQMLRKKPADFYKIAVTAKSTNDMLRLLHLVRHSNQLIAISMGEAGQASRILGSIFGSRITFASLDENNETAPGQLTINELINRYRYPSLSPSTLIYGLIGDPVKQSISDQTHNFVMQQSGLDAVYVKMPVKKEELAEFLSLAKQLNIRGLSVTMPLKEAIIPYIDCIDPDAEIIGAVNTLVFEKDGIAGFNTDGIGALNAIEEEMLAAGKRIVIIGAGGAAKAIAYEASKRGAIVSILNRTPDKAKRLARQLNCMGGGLENLPALFNEGYDLLINSTPSDDPIDPQYLIPHALIMDIKTRPMHSPLLNSAKEKNCRIVYGYKMFVHQAAAQFALWFNMDPQEVIKLLENSSKKALS